MHTISYIKAIPNFSQNNMGLQKAYESWQGLANIAEREAEKSKSIVGGLRNR